jgi:heme/copper-type cytochrome/quinol oxidase subunit 2
MRKLIKGIAASSAAAYALVYSAGVALAAATIPTWGTTHAPGGVPTDITNAIMNITNWILGFIAVIATLIVIYGGVQYLTAAGNEDQIANAKKTISYGVIGVVIAGLAYAIVIVVSTVILAG